MDRHSKSFSYVYYKNECLSLESGGVLVVNEKVFFFFLLRQSKDSEILRQSLLFFCPKDQAS